MEDIATGLAEIETEWQVQSTITMRELSPDGSV
jgi:hypothetical protein